MRITLRNGDCEIELEAEGGYSPDVMSDLLARALEGYAHAFADEDTDD